MLMANGRPSAAHGEGEARSLALRVCLMAEAITSSLALPPGTILAGQTGSHLLLPFGGRFLTNSLEQACKQPPAIRAPLCAPFSVPSKGRALGSDLLGAGTCLGRGNVAIPTWTYLQAHPALP